MPPEKGRRFWSYWPRNWMFAMPYILELAKEHKTMSDYLNSTIRANVVEKFPELKGKFQAPNKTKRGRPRKDEVEQTLETLEI